MKRNNILIPIVFISLLWVAANVLHYHFGLEHIRNKYEGKSASTWSKAKRRDMRPIIKSIYRKDVQRFFLKSSYCLAFSLLFLAVSRTRRDIPKFIIYSYREINLKECVNIFKTKTRANKRFLFAALALFAFFFIIYFSESCRLAKTSVFKEFNILFEVDTPRVIDDITNPSAAHHRTNVHPLSVLMLNPVGCWIKNIVHSDIIAASAINSFLGALAPCLALAFFFLVGGNYLTSILLAGVFGFSMSQLFVSTVPNTAALSVCSLLVTYILFLISLQRKQVWFVLWIAAGALSLGATISNFMQTLICFGLSAIVIRKEKNESALAKMTVFVVMVSLIAILLALIQHSLYQTRLFWQPSGYEHEFQYASFLILQHPLDVITEIAKHFFLANVVGPLPNIFETYFRGRILQAVTFTGSLHYTAGGWLAAGLWIVVLAGGIVRDIYNKERNRILYVGIALCLLFNLALHSYYGIGGKDNIGDIELFCYTGNFTFLIIALLGGYSASNRARVGIVLALLIALMGCNNLFVMRQILAVYK